MSQRAVVLQEIGASDSKPFAVGRHGQAFEGKWQRKVIFIECWCETEDEARAHAHRMDHP